MISIVNPKNLGLIKGEESYDDGFELSAHICSSEWSPSTFGPSGIRSNENWKACSLLVLDIDGGQSLEDAKVSFKGYKHIIATTRSHGRDKHGVVCDRFRVVICLDQSCIDANDYAATWSEAFAKWPFIDEKCKDPARFYYPCLDVIRIANGQEFAVVKAPPQPAAPPRPLIASDTKGGLAKFTLNFLLEGAPGGQWNQALFKSAKDLQQQRYTLEEAMAKFSGMTHKYFTGKLDKHDIKTIESAYNNDPKYEPHQAPAAYVPSSEFLTAEDLWDETKSYLSDKGKVEGDPTGIEGLDKMLGGGARAGELTVLLAQAKTGKNTLLHNILFKSLSKRVPYGYASREMAPGTEVMPDLLCMHLKKNVYKGELKEEYREIYRQWPVHFTHGFGFMSHDATERFFDKCKKAGVNHFIYDHFHRGLKFENYEAVEQHMRFLKRLTKQFECHLFLVVQPKALQEGEELSLASPRGGAVIGQELNNLLILKRRKDQPHLSELILEVARHKLAKPGSIYLKYDPETIIMEEVEKGSVAPPPVSGAAEPRWKNLRAQ